MIQERTNRDYGSVSIWTGIIGNIKTFLFEITEVLNDTNAIFKSYIAVFVHEFTPFSSMPNLYIVLNPKQISWLPQ